MKRRKILLPLLLLALLLAACAQQRAQPESPAQTQTPEPAQLGTLEDLMRCEFWNLTKDEFVAQLDPDLWSAWTPYPDTVLPETYYRGQIAGLEATLDAVMLNTGSPAALTLSTTITMDEAQLINLSPVGGSPFRGTVPIAGGPEDLAQWVCSVRETLAAEGWTLGENALRLHGETPEELETMFRETLADRVRLYGGYLISEFSYQEYLYHAPNGASARISGYGWLSREGTSSDAPLRCDLRLTLQLMAPGQLEDLDSPPTDPYAYWAAGEPHPASYAASVCALVGRGAFAMTPQAVAELVNPHRFSVQEDGGATVLTGSFSDAGTPLTLRLTPGADGCVVRLDARQAPQTEIWQLAGWIETQRSQLGAQNAVLREADGVRIDGTGSRLLEPQLERLQARVCAQAEAAGAPVTTLLREGPYIFPDGQTAAFFTLELTADAQAFTGAQGRLLILGPDWRDEDGRRALDAGFENDPDGFFSGAQLAETGLITTLLDFAQTEFWNLTPTELESLLDPAFWQDGTGTVLGRSAQLQAETGDGGLVRALTLRLLPEADAPADEAARMVLSLRNLLKLSESEVLPLQQLPGETLAELAPPETGVLEIYCLNPLGVQLTLARTQDGICTLTLLPPQHGAAALAAQPFWDCAAEQFTAQLDPAVWLPVEAEAADAGGFYRRGVLGVQPVLLCGQTGQNGTLDALSLATQFYFPEEAAPEAGSLAALCARSADTPAIAQWICAARQALTEAGAVLEAPAQRIEGATVSTLSARYDTLFRDLAYDCETSAEAREQEAVYRLPTGGTAEISVSILYTRDEDGGLQHRVDCILRLFAPDFAP